MKKTKFILDHLNGQKARFIIVLLCVLAYFIFTVIDPLIYSFMIDQVINNEPTNSSFLLFITNLLGGMDYIRENLWTIALVLIFVYLMMAIFMAARVKNQAIIAESLSKQIREDMYNHIEHLPFSLQKNLKTGDMVQRCTSDIDMIRRFFNGQIEEVFGIFVNCILSIYIMFTTNLKMAIIASISFPIVFLYSYLHFIKMIDAFKLSDEKESEMTVDIQEALSGVRVIKAFNRENYILNKFNELSHQYESITEKMLMLIGRHWGGSYLISALGILLVLIFGIIGVRNGEISVGILIIFINYQTKLLMRIRRLGRILSDFSKVQVSCNRLIEIKEMPIEDLYQGENVDLDGDIVFDNVSFKYDDDDQYVVKNISFTISKGETVAILGPTGSGKSSLVNLLARLYDVSEGHIYIDGHDINLLSKSSLRKNVGIVLQESFLFSKTIYDNLKISNPLIDRNTIENATKTADVHDVIEKFDKGYDTLVGEKGVTLSGGQKQRIAIARTIINDTPIIIFDDSLSAVDTKTDMNIRKSLKQFDSDTTMIIITQRISSAKDADKIIIIENGEISAIGTHDELIHKPGLYQRVNDIQNQRMKEELNV